MHDTDDENSYLGSFWLPNQDETTAVPGVMEFGARGKIAVRLQGVLSESGLIEDAIVYAKLHGRHTKATLYNCFTTYSSSDRTNSRFESTLAAMGTLSQHLCGRNAQFRLLHTQKWFHESGFDVRFNEHPEEIVVRIKWTESTIYELADGLTLERFYTATVPMGNWGEDQFKVVRPMEFRLSSQTRLDFDRLWQMMYRLRRFLEFLSQQRCPHSHLALRDETEALPGQHGIEIRHSELHAAEPKKFEWDAQLVPFSDINDRFPQLLRRWFEVCEENYEPFSRYFAAFDHDRTDAILHFLWNVAALEELHKLRTTRASRMNKGFDLLDRLRDICGRWSGAFDVAPPDTVLQQIKDTRHYYAHAAGDLKHKAAKEWTLLRYADFISALCNLEMLAMVGLSDEEVVRLTNRYWMREALALRTYPSD